jgi:gamma-glutamyltranspeptidase/glutathione hydrolase
MDKGHGAPRAPEVGDAEGILFLAARVALFVALLGVGIDHLGRAEGDAHATHADGHAAPTAQLELPTLPSAPTALGEAAVAAASPEASQAGLTMLRRHGNAFDAVVAASFAVCVTRPHATGIAGGGFAVVHLDASTRDLALDGRETAPASASRDMYRERPEESVFGPRAGGVPGFVALMYELHRGQGKLPWADVLGPAIQLARQGFPIDRGLAAAIAAHQEELARWPSSAEVFLPGGKPLRAGETLRQPDLARTLERIAQAGLDGFYAGETAALIAAGTPITLDDLRGYQVRKPEPLVGTFRGLDLVTMGPPTSGGVVLLQVLRVLEGLDLKAARAAADGSYEHLLAEALRHAHADRSVHLGDEPDQKAVVEWLLSATRTDQIRAAIDPARARPLDQVGPGAPPRESDHTTHVSVIDDLGNAVSVTHTINRALGSCYVIPGTGMLLNDEMDDFAARPGEANSFGLVQGEKNAIAPGKRPLSSMTPLLVIDRQRAVAAIGSPGGPRIISAVLQVFLNAFDAQLPLEEALRAPRVHHQWRPDWLAVEGELPTRVAESLARRGHRVRRGDTLGEVQAVFRVGDRACLGASDPRGTGKPAALTRE